MRMIQVLVLLCTVLSLVVGFLFWTDGARAADPLQGSYWDAATARFVRERVASTYVDRLDAPGQREAFYRAMRGYVDLDPYCDFITPERLKSWREDISGKYAGLGVRVEESALGPRLAGVLPGGPASVAGLQVGDVLVRAAGTPLAGMALADITPLLKGGAGTTVRLGVVRGPEGPDGLPQGDEREIVVTRDFVRPPLLFTRRVGPEGRVAVVRLKEFAEEGAGLLDQQLDAMLKAGAKGLVLDLRGNNGGVLGVALRLAHRFLQRGLILRTEGRGDGQNKQHVANAQDNDLPDLPLVVLVDGGSASASEVVAGALQDHRRALLVGTRTYGKFLVQQITEIPSSGAAVKLTTSRYYTPSGRSYQRHAEDGGDDPAGLFPDVVVPLDEEQTTRLAKQRRDEEGAVWGMPQDYPEVAPDWVDPQLARAIQVLSGEITFSRIGRAPARDG